MAILLLASTISWKVEKHYCLGHLIDIALFTSAQDCGMSMNGQSDNHKEQVEEENSCCTDEIIISEGQNDLGTVKSDFSLSQQLFLVAYTYSYFNLFGNGIDVQNSKTSYPQPIIVKDIHLLDKVFLI